MRLYALQLHNTVFEIIWCSCSRLSGQGLVEFHSAGLVIHLSFPQRRCWLMQEMVANG